MQMKTPGEIHAVATGFTNLLQQAAKEAAPVKEHVTNRELSYPVQARRLVKERRKASSKWDEPKNISLPATGVKLCKLFTYPLRNVKPPIDTLPEVSAPLCRPSK